MTKQCCYYILGGVCPSHRREPEAQGEKRGDPGTGDGGTHTASTPPTSTDLLYAVTSGLSPNTDTFHIFIYLFFYNLLVQSLVGRVTCRKTFM